MEFEEIGTENRLSLHLPAAPYINNINGHDDDPDGDIRRRTTTAIVSDQKEFNEVDHDVTTKLGAAGDKRLFIDSLIKHIENDNLRLLHRQKQRTDRY